MGSRARGGGVGDVKVVGGEEHEGEGGGAGRRREEL